MAAPASKIFLSRRVVLPENVQPALLLVSNGKIMEVIACSSEAQIKSELQKYPGAELEDFGRLVLMPGLVDSHVHVNEPGRAQWEGFSTATRAAAAGGVTTIVDMPLNAIPPTTTLENLKTKARIAKTKSVVDVAFWGGVIPGNQKELKPLIEAGVIGFKCFMINSCIDEFPHVNEDDIKNALLELQDFNSVLAFHAECEVNEVTRGSNNGDPSYYKSYLQSRPSTMEIDAIRKVADLCKAYNCHCHIVHLSAAEALGLLREAKAKQLPLTAETCYHYLHLAAEKIPRGATEFKCCPPIRDEANREKLWSALKDGTLDMVVSDHSPCPEDLKSDDFMSAWGGISSLQFGLPLLWTEARNRGLSFQDVTRVTSSAPAKLCGLEKRKGALKAGMDADFVVWNPDATIEIERDGIFHKNKLTPYLGEKLFGKVVATLVRSNFVYKDGKLSEERPLGQLLLRDDFLSDL